MTQYSLATLVLEWCRDSINQSINLRLLFVGLLASGNTLISGMKVHRWMAGVGEDAEECAVEDGNYVPTSKATSIHSPFCDSAKIRGHLSPASRTSSIVLSSLR